MVFGEIVMGSNGFVMNSPVQQTTPRVQVMPLLRILVLALVLPVVLAFLADWALGTSPVIVIVVTVICIPLASLLMINRALRDLNALIAAVAPSEAPEDENAGAVEFEAQAQPVLLNDLEIKATPKENSHIGGSNSLPMD